MTSSTSNAEHFLAQWAIPLSELRSYVRPLDRSETLLLVGSIPDGLANEASDIDLLIIGDRTLEANLVLGEAGFEQSMSRLPGGQEVNAEYWRADEVAALERRHSSILDAIDDPRLLQKLEVFSHDELRILHRIGAGVALANVERAAELRRRLRLDRLPDYLLLYFTGFHYGLREDAIAQVRGGDAISALWMLRFALDFLGGAMLASVGVTNSDPKWRPRLLDRQRSALGSSHVDAMLRYLFPDPKQDVGALVEEALAFSDRMLAEALERRPALLPAMMELNDKITFVKHFDELPEAKGSRA